MNDDNHSRRGSSCKDERVQEPQPEHEEGPPKEVAFDSSVLVFEDTNFAREERKEIFYTKEEMRSFRSDLWRFAESNQAAFQQRPASEPATSCCEDEACIAWYAGMDGFLFPEHKSKHKLQGILSVLMEQERQYKEQGLWTPVDFESMSHFYHVASQESQEEAHQRALMQRKIVNAHW